MYVADIYVSPQNYALVGVGFTFTILAIIFVSARIVTRVWLVRNIGIDDAFIVLSALGTLGFLIGAMEQIRYGLGSPVNLKTLSKTIQATMASVVAYTVCHLAVKLSISFQCLRIFPSVAARRIFISFIVFLCIYGPLCLLLTIISCWPVAKYWDDSIKGKCLDNRATRYAFAGINIVNDIALLIAPMPFLSSLQIARRAKYVLIGVFACGGGACIIAIIRLYSLYEYSSVAVKDRPLKGIDIALWSSLECNIAIMCACVPAIKPMFSKAFPGLVTSLTSSKGRTAGRYAHGTAHTYDNISRSVGVRSGTRSHLDVEDRGIKIEQEFEMRTTAVSDDNDSEKDLVTGNTVPAATGSGRLSGFKITSNIHMESHRKLIKSATASNSSLAEEISQLAESTDSRHHETPKAVIKELLLRLYESIVLVSEREPHTRTTQRRILDGYRTFFAPIHALSKLPGGDFLSARMFLYLASGFANDHALLREFPKGSIQKRTDTIADFCDSLDDALLEPLRRIWAGCDKLEDFDWVFTEFPVQSWTLTESYQSGTEKSRVRKLAQVLSPEDLTAAGFRRGSFLCAAASRTPEDGPDWQPFGGSISHVEEEDTDQRQRTQVASDGPIRAYFSYFLDGGSGSDKECHQVQILRRSLQFVLDARIISQPSLAVARRRLAGKTLLRTRLPLEIKGQILDYLDEPQWYAFMWQKDLATTYYRLSQMGFHPGS
ncbi:hypothetical protein G7046_g1765 [Stylonectria norvegica]|nr:hypothetical protein G7046_g1765 [Stylonectria norvegica]